MRILERFDTPQTFSSSEKLGPSGQACIPHGNPSGMSSRLPPPTVHRSKDVRTQVCTDNDTSSLGSSPRGHGPSFTAETGSELLVRTADQKFEIHLLTYR